MAKKEYKQLLKEAISEFDTSKTVEVKGPMLDPILKWDGGGEVPTNKDAASILERYYFNDDQDKFVEEMDYNDDGKPDKGSAMKHTQGAGTEQAGTDDKGMDKHEEEIAKEAEELDKDVDEGDLEDMKEQDEMKDDDEEEKEDEMAESAVLEKLIAEMEEEEDENDEEGVEEAELMAGDNDWEGVKSDVEAKDEKKTKNPEEDSQGAGTKQAGTGNADGQVPDRKDMADAFVDPKHYTEAEEMDDEKDEELDVDDKVSEGTPLTDITDEEKDEDLKEAFELFSEQIEEDDDEV